LAIYHGMKGLARWRGTVAEPETETAGLPPAVKSAMNAAAKRSGKKGK
jgi:NCS2 family nucleobase:cation symporter-2